jgi:hypothetical protein
MAQSSIEWLFEQYKLIGMLTTAQVEKAKAMHKEEVMDAHYAPKYGCFSKDYYNETFNTK